MQRRKFLRGDLAFKIMAVAAMPPLVLMLPIILPVALAGDALSERRLGRTKCGNCQSLIGQDEIRRAKQETGIDSRRRIRSLVGRGLKPRIVTPWRIACPTCGARYLYRSNRTRGLEPVSLA